MKPKEYCPDCNKELGEDDTILRIDQNKGDKITRLVESKFCDVECLMKSISLGAQLLDKIRYDGKDRIKPRQTSPEVAKTELRCKGCDKTFKGRDDNVLLLIEKFKNNESLGVITFNAFCSLECLHKDMEATGKKSSPGRALGSRFDIEIPKDSKVNKNLQECLDNIKACFYCHHPLFHGGEFGLLSQFELNSKPIKIVNIVMCDPCFEEVSKALQDVIDKLNVRKKS